MPKRIQRKRTKGWRMPENTVYVGRPTWWGNPFHGGGCIDDQVADYRHWVTTSDSDWAVWVREHIHELKGKNLACWCRLDWPCHADVLLEMANPTKYVRITVQGGNSYIQPYSKIAEAIDGELDCLDYTHPVTIRFSLVNMTDEEYEQLPEFQGH